ncbi:MAG TPA: hypothetical protein VJ719_04605 [Chthoniobacterales bacterium]|nr:hypothetical protein [Chthoniobacterales bacterium]
MTAGRAATSADGLNISSVSCSKTTLMTPNSRSLPNIEHEKAHLTRVRLEPRREN